jgi:hypothetical protein
MAQDDGHRRRERAVADEQVGVADARGRDPHPDLVGLQARELDRGQLEVRAGGLHDGGGDGGGTHWFNLLDDRTVSSPVHPAGLVASAR